MTGVLGSVPSGPTAVDVALSLPNLGVICIDCQATFEALVTTVGIIKPLGVSWVSVDDLLTDIRGRANVRDTCFILRDILSLT